MKALILAGGKGTRLSSLTGGTVPKPMAEMDGKPVLLRAVESLKRCGVTDFLFTVGHLHEKITDYFGDGSRFGVKIFYLIESEPLGSGGALFYAKDFFEDTLLVCSGDTVFDIDVASMLAFHREKRAEITLLAHPNSHPYDSDLIVTDGSDRVTEIDFKGNERRRWYANKVNAGFFLFEKSAFDYFTEAKKCNLERDFIYDRVKNGRPVYAYSSAEYIKDVGTPERFQAVEREVKAGIPAQKRRGAPKPCVFLDRDGVLNRYRGFIRTPDELEVFPGAGAAVRRLNDARVSRDSRHQPAGDCPRRLYVRGARSNPQQAGNRTRQRGRVSGRDLFLSAPSGQGIPGRSGRAEMRLRVPQAQNGNGGRGMRAVHDRPRPLLLRRRRRFGRADGDQRRVKDRARFLRPAGDGQSPSRLESERSGGGRGHHFIPVKTRFSGFRFYTIQGSFYDQHLLLCG